MGRFPSSLRTGLILIVALAVLPPLGLAIYTNLEQRRLGVQELRADTLRFTRLAAANQEHLVEGARQLLLALAQLPEVLNPAYGDCDKLLAKLSKHYPHYSIFGATDENGNKYCSSVSPDDRLNVADRAWFRRAVESRDFAVGNFEIGRATNKPTVHLSYPIRDKAEHICGVVFAGLDLEKINPFTAKAELVDGARVFVLDREGTILSRYPEPEKWIGKPMPDRSIVEAIQKEGEGIKEERDENGVDRLYAFTQVHTELDTGLYVSIGTPLAVGLAGAERLLFRNLTGLGLACVLALTAAWYVGDLFLLRRVRELLSATQRLASGDLSARSGLQHGRDEFSRLAGAFDEMAASLEQRTLQLGQAETRYRNLVEQIPAVTYSARLEGVCRTTFISPQIEALTGFTAEEWLADPDLWYRRVQWEDRERLMAGMARKVPGKEKTEFTFEYRFHARDGRVVWVSDKGVIERQGAGEFPAVQGVMIDITDRHTAEEKLLLYQEQLRSLASELSLTEERERRRIAVDLHDYIAQKLALSKIKLETISESASCTGVGEQIRLVLQFLDQAIQDTRSLINRISSPILYELGFEAAVEWLIEEFQRLHSVPCAYENDGLPKQLDNDIRVILFQSVNELLVNVAKHADATGCRLSIRRDDRFIRIELKDNGVGFDAGKLGPHRCKAGGFGLFSIRERLNLVGGFLEIDSEPGRGTRMALVAPLKVGKTVDTELATDKKERV